MAKQKEENLGVFIVKHPSGMLETDKGEKSFQGNIGDTFMRGEDGKTFIVAKGAGVAAKETKAQKEARLAEEARLEQEALDAAEAAFLDGSGEDA